ncbi:MAG: hypothetical protein CM1200mP39_24680 [Dehalococcoidia bacterium]|nr:MAG: hypothetical protein CM1200mP39_24680 [Dehalococcoidia bacterium]
MAYTTGPWMTHRHPRVGYGADDVKSWWIASSLKKVVFHDGDIEFTRGFGCIRLAAHRWTPSGLC